jgi:Fur family transcriptional regulator, ferric uptake regulator
MQMQTISNNTDKKQQRKQDSYKLKKYGKRVTSQRTLILDIIKKGGGHLDADDIYRQARAELPRLSLSTVYRTLKTLKEPGLIEELQLDDTHHYYEIKSNKKHYHLVCIGCGKVVEFRYPLDQNIKKDVPEARDFKITEVDIRVRGYCPQCQKKMKNTPDK